jgi:hypothetical protein
MAVDPYLPIAEVLAFAGTAAHGLYFSSTDVPPRAQPPAGRRFARHRDLRHACVRGAAGGAEG